MFSKRIINIKNYIQKLFGERDESMKQIIEQSFKQKLPKIHISASVGRFLYILVKIKKPLKILEIGTLAGYSTLWMAKALEDNAHIITLEKDSLRAKIARENFLKNGFEKKIRLIEGNALQSLEKLQQDAPGSFDFIFIDADKENMTHYLSYALKLSKKNTLIISDNVIPRGEEMGVLKTIDSIAMLEHNEMIALNPNLESTLLPTLVNDFINDCDVGRIDGISIALVK
jgi:predicted O-methyltransferase YrrM